MNEIVEKSQALVIIENLENHLKKLPQMENNVRHFMCVDGVYMREFSMPAGYVCTGKVHTTESYTVITKGCVSIVNDSGEHLLMKAGDISYSKAGSKKAVYSIQDSLFLTVHHCDLKDIHEIESYLSVDTMEEYQKRIAK